ncbi:FAD-dependent oxidoreductase [Cocleimonas flava]|uniref:Glycine/D-amino acid oxidase-like deaminating enzyme n=1 Tax=Cocleimonas flava TaxID=634765 RepID=A0A4R1ETE0_9GAMM|nr:FAD-dependent oxidoreductase [Cocleimonas flava]TCJ83064.1 glycine/D-amino acid oxidase-like deaminating enzyme [Cocleimonas flava]
MNSQQKARQALSTAKFGSFWLDAEGKPPELPALTEELRTDLLIVGAGFTGLWAAIHAKEAQPDRNVVIIEADSIAIGASGRPAAILSTSVMHGMENAQRLFPNDMDVLEELGKENLDGFKDAIERYKIDCDLEWGGELTVAVGEQGIPDIESEYQLYKKYGHDAHLLNKDEIQKEIHSPLFHGGLWSKKRSGTVHPAKLAWGLKRTALNLGVKIFENTPMQSNTKTQEGIVVTTPNGTVTAPKVLLATNAFKSCNKKIHKRVSAIRDRIVMTEPLSAEQMKSIGWENRQGIYDTRTQLNYMRLTADNRVLFGGRLNYFFNNNTDQKLDNSIDPFIMLVENFHKTFPSLETVQISHAWSGPIALTTRMAVHYQRYHNGDMIYAGGYSGFGVTATRFGAKVGLDILDGKETKASKLTFANTLPSYIPPEPFRWIGAKVTMYALDTVDQKGGWRKTWLKMVEKMGFPVMQ